MVRTITENASKQNLKNIEFIDSKIESLTLPPNFADCMLANCVFNPLPNEAKLTALKEVHRVLKPGGRLSISDTVVKKPLPDTLSRADIATYVGCVAGAIDIVTYESYLRDAGFKGS
jgi:arsenite methyltransferase